MNLLATSLLPALGAAVLHFLWQGALLGLLAALLLRITKGKSPEFRYGLSCALLLTMVGTFVATWLGQAPRPMPIPGSLMVADAAMNVRLLQDFPESPLRSGLAFGLPWVAWGWVLGTAVMLMRTGSGLLWLHLGLARGAHSAPASWQARLDTLRHGIGLARTIRLKVSAALDSPVVVGALKPVILMPTTVLSGLSPNQVEAILMHELSHIRRHDYLVNLLQVLAEALLFFHPAVWWLSREIRREREHCCDDAAVRRCGDALYYASALAALEALRIPPISTRLAPAAKGGLLMQRIQRLLVPRSTPNTGYLPTLGLVAVLLASGTAGHRLQAKVPTAATTPVAALSIPAPMKDVSSPPVIVKAGEPTVTATEPETSKMPSATVEVVDSSPVEPQPFAGATLEPSQLQSFFQAVPASSFTILSKPGAFPYPTEARGVGLQGTVSVLIRIGVDGKPELARALSGPPALQAHSERYAMGWTFTPPTMNGQPSSGGFLLHVNYRLFQPNPAATNTLAGRILDSGRPVEGATVAVFSITLGAGNQSKTDAEGKWSAPSLPSAPDWCIQVTLPGFKPVKVQGLQLTGGLTIRQDTNLQPEG